MVGQQVFIRLAHEATFEASTASRRAIAVAVLGSDRGLGSALGLGLLAYRQTPRFIRIVVVGDKGRELARRIAIALARRRAGPARHRRFQPARVKPLLDQWHLDGAVRQLLRQAGEAADDPLAEGSNLPDLLGLRTTGRHTCATVRCALPRICRDDLLRTLGVERLEPAVGPVELIVDAAAAVVARANLTSKAPNAIAASRAAIEVALDAGLNVRQVAGLLGVSRSTVTRRLKGPADPALVQVVKLQLALRRERLGQRLVPSR